MKYFSENPNTWGEKINFVDHNNRLVGYDFSQDCCENFGWFITPTADHQARDHIILDASHAAEHIQQLLDGWVFDATFFQEHSHGYEYQGATFRMVKHQQEMFLHLFNEHNGYYAHGFEFLEEGREIRKGYL